MNLPNKQTLRTSNRLISNKQSALIKLKIKRHNLSSLKRGLGHADCITSGSFLSKIKIPFPPFAVLQAQHKQCRTPSLQVSQLGWKHGEPWEKLSHTKPSHTSSTSEEPSVALRKLDLGPTARFFLWALSCCGPQPVFHSTEYLGAQRGWL